MQLRTPVTCAAVLAGCLVLTACSSNQAPKLANEVCFSLDGISDVTISYDEEEVTFYESEDDTLVLKEYMTDPDSSYYAQIVQRRDSIQISEGGKPLLHDGFSRYIEVYLPASYHDDLTVTTTDGDIDLTNIALSLDDLRIDSTAGVVQLHDAVSQTIHLSSTSGVLELGRLRANTIRIDTTSGNTTCETLSGTVTYTTTSGNAYIESSTGSGSYKANNSGDLHVAYSDVTGDLSFYNKNGDIHVALPADLEFSLAATTKNGSISTALQEGVSTDGSSTNITVGEHPTVTVTVETKNGNMEVTQ